MHNTSVGVARNRGVQQSLFGEIDLSIFGKDSDTIEAEHLLSSSNDITRLYGKRYRGNIGEKRSATE